MADKVELMKANTVERWWSSQARNHTIDLSTKSSTVVAKFSQYALSLDLSEPQDKAVSDGLKEHPQKGRSFFLVGGPAKDDDRGRKQKTELLRMLRKIVSDNMIEGRIRAKGIEQIRAIFSNEELAKAKLDISTQDADALLQLAMDTKTLVGLE